MVEVVVEVEVMVFIVVIVVAVIVVIAVVAFTSKTVMYQLSLVQKFERQPITN